MIELTLERTLELLDEAVAGKPEGFRYVTLEEVELRRRTGDVTGMCRYLPYEINHDGTELAEDDPRRTTGCLVGTVLAAAGINVEDWQGGADTVCTDLRYDQDVHFSTGVISVLGSAQGQQDRGATWADARDFARGEAQRWLDRGAE